MPYRQTQFYAHGDYHIFNRGHNKNPIFKDKGDYTYFLQKLRKYLKKFKITIIAYCLIPNHYHFQLKQNSAISTSQFMRDFICDYAKFFNWKYKTRGSLFEGPFKAREIKKENYLLYLSKYIHLNPKLHKIVSNLEDWPWSSYLDYIGKRKGTLCNKEIILEDYFKAHEPAAPRLVLSADKTNLGATQATQQKYQNYINTNIDEIEKIRQTKKDFDKLIKGLI